MVNNNLELSIKTLTNDTLKMMDKCIEVIEKCVLSIINKDMNLAREVISLDDDIDNLKFHITEKSIELIALKQPMAKDLRVIYALGNMVIELERIGDYSTNIAMEAIKIGSDEHVKTLIDIPKMGEVSMNMLKKAKFALETYDSKSAYKAAKEDEVIDNLYNDVYIYLLAAMHKDSENINQGVKLLFAARYLERIGDHITNICEKIIYAIKGDMIEIG